MDGVSCERSRREAAHLPAELARERGERVDDGGELGPECCVEHIAACRVETRSRCALVVQVQQKLGVEKLRATEVMHNVAQVALRAHAARVARRRLLLRRHVRLRVLRRQ